jgi:hypothetical protein
VKCYALSKTPGVRIAKLNSQYTTDGLITAADMDQKTGYIYLLGYEYQKYMLKPFLLLLYDYRSNNLFSGNKRRFGLDMYYTQTEGIAIKQPGILILSNELLRTEILSVPSSLHLVNIAECMK